jgi:hypothetical protein
LNSEAKQSVKEVTFFCAVSIAIAMVATSFYIGISALYQVGETAIERKVFENSYQYESSRSSKNKILVAQLVQIGLMLKQKNLHPDRRRQLEAKAAGLRILAQ